MKGIFFISIFLFCGTVLSAQNHIENFSVDQVNESVHLKFTMLQGSICTGIKIYRGIDSLNTSEIGEIPGICGSLLEPVIYDYIDDKPEYNQTNYYKIDLSGLGYSDFRKIKVLRYSGESLLIFPNPVSGLLSLHVQKNRGEMLELQIFNTMGEAVAVHFKENFGTISFDVSHLDQGIYYLKVLSDDQVLDTKKFIRQ